ncbi:RNA polymerase sigma factor SigJ [Phytohabitans aurantiacus]|uniref:RNA polymerase sigma factor n=1 Tax=Phytohabitans aurantiacus TaxID=3016789 RepID=A0ABQ5QWY5_9ACTN|nr:RNA polymerase sigma factor SigJ [Phytohabitans aurantiacus]GLH98777.1 RNA polymerase sigma factor [Phytohabitans aurantiacus]
MDHTDQLAARFEEHRSHLRAVAYRLLGSFAEADDAVQETWLRLSRADSAEVVNLGGWLTTVVSRVCLNLLRDRRHRDEQPLDTRVPDPIISEIDGGDPAHEVVLADSVSVAMLVVLETLSPPERLAFVLHDLFAMPFDEIGPILDRTPTTTRQLASRARRRVRGATPASERDQNRQRAVVEAFLAAARGGDLATLVDLLHPEVVVRSDGGAVRPSTLVRGPEAVAQGAIVFARIAELTRPVLVNGAVGAVAMSEGRVVAVAAFTVADGKVLALNILNDPERLPSQPAGW